ncbi:MAG: RluA family pseudouridine synthase [Alphaproteobacteria bacterium]|nr:RluA family pseudouridine synthase [Alphaproteobacteria bacterium]
MNDLRFMPVKEDDDGQRLDRWIKKYVPEMPYVLAQKLMRKGQIRVDGKRAKPETRLSAGQEIKIPRFEITSQQPKSKPKITHEDEVFMRSLVLYEDEHVIAIDKPGGLAVQGGTNTKRHVDGLLEVLKDKKGVIPRLVHRLDKETSGVMLLARSAECARVLGKMLKEKRVKKIYWAIVTPTPETLEGTITAPIIKSSGNYEKMVVDDEEGKNAITEYTVLENASRAAAFVAFWPRTGRTHQIRVHASQVLGSAVLGDGKYRAVKDEESKLLDADLAGMDLAKRLHLHARRLILEHPLKKGQILDITAPLAPDLVKSWKSFGFSHKDKSDPFERID